MYDFLFPLFPLLLCLFNPFMICDVAAIGQTTCVSFSFNETTFPVVQNGVATPIFISSDEWPGVQRAASDFVSDIELVTQIKPTLSNLSASETTNTTFANAIIVGTLGRSSLIDQVINNTQLDVSSIQGLWEAFMGQEVANPLPGVDSAYVIIGSDRRGTMFGMYDLSEQFGGCLDRSYLLRNVLSLFYLQASHLGIGMTWFLHYVRPAHLPIYLFEKRWADVVPTNHSELFITSPGCSHGPPTVQYRGIFLNDEQPALTNWALEKFTNGPGGLGTATPANGTGSPFQSEFYSKLYVPCSVLTTTTLNCIEGSSSFFASKETTFGRVCIFQHSIGK